MNSGQRTVKPPVTHEKNGSLQSKPVPLYNDTRWEPWLTAPVVWGVLPMSQIWWLAVVAIVLLAAAAYRWRPRRGAPRAVRLVHVKRRFHFQRERLEAKFIQLAAAHATGNAPRWADCTFADDVAYVRDRTTGELSAFVPMTVATEESDRSLPGTADAVGNLQAGTAVFRFDRDHWETDGRAILNLSPTEAVHFDGKRLEIVGEELAHHRS